MPAACENRCPAAHDAAPNHGANKSNKGEIIITVEDEGLQRVERGDGWRHLLHHVAAHAMAHEVQEDDAVLGRSVQPARQLPQLIRRQTPEAGLIAFVFQFPVGPAVGISPQVQLRRELLAAVQSKPQVIVERHSGEKMVVVGGGGERGGRGGRGKVVVVVVSVNQTLGR